MQYIFWSSILYYFSVNTTLPKKYEIVFTKSGIFGAKFDKFAQKNGRRKRLEPISIRSVRGNEPKPAPLDKNLDMNLKNLPVPAARQNLGYEPQNQPVPAAGMT